MRDLNHNLPQIRVLFIAFEDNLIQPAYILMRIILELLILNVVIVNLANLGLDCINIRMVLHIEMIFAPTKPLQNFSSTFYLIEELKGLIEFSLRMYRSIYKIQKEKSFREEVNVNKIKSFVFLILT